MFSMIKIETLLFISLEYYLIRMINLIRKLNRNKLSVEQKYRSIQTLVQDDSRKFEYPSHF